MATAHLNHDAGSLADSGRLRTEDRRTRSIGYLFRPGSSPTDAPVRRRTEKAGWAKLAPVTLPPFTRTVSKGSTAEAVFHPPHLFGVSPSLASFSPPDRHYCHRPTGPSYCIWCRMYPRRNTVWQVYSPMPRSSLQGGNATGRGGSWCSSCVLGNHRQRFFPVLEQSHPLRCLVGSS